MKTELMLTLEKAIEDWMDKQSEGGLWPSVWYPENLTVMMAQAAACVFDANKQLGFSVGVDEYVPKFEPHRLAEVLNRLLK